MEHPRGDLVSRVLAAIEESERLALAAQDFVGDGAWSVGRSRGSGEPYVRGEVAAVCSLMEESSALHIAHNDPAAVLRRCQADKGMLAEHPELNGYCERCSQDEEQPQPVGWWMPYPCRTVQLLAASYGIPVEEEDDR